MYRLDAPNRPSCSQSFSPSANNKKSRNFLKLFFRSSVAERNAQKYILREGSITDAAWTGMSRQSTGKVRQRTLENLEEVIKKRRLQVDTLEGIWAEINDMLTVAALRKTFLRFMCSVTRAQCEELGSALRSTFFNTIKDIGFEELSVQWLVALTDGGRNLNSLEYCVGELLVDWLDAAFRDDGVRNDFYYTPALELIELIEKIFIHNATFIRDTHLRVIINKFCRKMCNCQPFFIIPLSSCCEAVLKYSHIPKSELMPLVVALCLTVSNVAHRQNTWRLMRILLSSVNAYTVLCMLQAILSNFYESYADDVPSAARTAIVRGAVYYVAMALWGSQRIDSLKVSSSIIVPALSEALTLHPIIAHEVLSAIRRLIGKFGKSLQQLTWACVIQLLERSVKYVKMANLSKTGDVHAELIQIILLIESLYLQNCYCGSLDALFQLIESCSADLPDESVFHLIDYRVSCINPLAGDWLARMLALIRHHIAADRLVKHREKALCVLGKVYHKYRLLYETEVVKRLALVVCRMIPDERDANFQYQLIVLLFDVAKSVSVRLNNDLFLNVIQLIREVLNGDVVHFVRSDNLEMIACCVNELLNERWSVFDVDLLKSLLSMIIEHLSLQYSLSLYDIVGSDVRARLFETLLLIQMEPSTFKLARVMANVDQPSRVPNQHIIVDFGGYTADDHSSNYSLLKCGSFQWTEVCKITIKALRIERSWSVIRKILECLNGLLECRKLVHSAGETFVNYFVSSIIELFYRFERDHFLLYDRDDEFWWLFCPVLGRLVNYSQDVQLCKTIVECVKSNCVQALVTCNLAVQVLPEKMAILSRQLIDSLLSLQCPNSGASGQQLLPTAVVELVSDSADAERFISFFQEKQFKQIVDILVLYTNPSHFNIFVVVSAHSALMRWFVRTPDRLRPIISRYAIDRLMTLAEENGALSNLSDLAQLKPLSVAPRRESSQLVDAAVVLSTDVSNSMEVATGAEEDLSTSPCSRASVAFSSSSSAIAPARLSSVDPMTLFDRQSEPSRNSSVADVEDNLKVVSEIVTTPLVEIDIASANDAGNAYKSAAPSFSIGSPTSLSPTTAEPVAGSGMLPSVLSVMNGDVEKPNNFVYNYEEVKSELKDMLRLFMRFWRKGNNSDRLFYQRRISASHVDLMFCIESDSENSKTSTAPWTVTETGVEHWTFDNSIITVRTLQRKGIGRHAVESRKVTFSGNRPLSTSGINLLVNEPPAEKEVADGSKLIPCPIDINTGQSSAGITGGNVIARSNSSPPNSLAITSRLDDNGPSLIANPTDSDNFKLPIQFRRRNFSNTQGMKHNVGVGASSSRQNMSDLNTPGGGIGNDSGSYELDLEYVQIVLRHTFGKESWILRPSDHIPIDFHTGVGGWIMEDISSFLMHMGGGSVSRVPLKENDSIQRSLRILDHMKAVELHTIGVLYVGEEQSDGTEILANQYGSERYMKFIRLLGDPVSLEEAPGGLQQGTHGEYTLEYRDHIAHIVFLIATLMPNSDDDPKCDAKKSLIGNNFVSVVFNESGKPYRLGTVSGKFDKISIEVIPQDEDTVVFKLHARREVAFWMAMRGICLTDADAACVLRRLIVRAQLSVNIARSIEDCRHNAGLKPYLSQAIDRLRKIRSFRDKAVQEI